MSETPTPAATEPGGSYASVTDDGFTVESNSETAAQMKENFAAEPKPKDGPPPDPDADEAERASKAAAELGKRGGKAAAEKRAAEAEGAEDGKEAKAEGEGEDDGKAKKDHRGDPRHDPKARMLEATRKEAEAKKALAEERRQRQELERRLAEVERRQRGPEPGAAPQGAPSDEDAEPQEQDFENYREYVKAQARWESRQAVREAIHAERQRTQREAHVAAFAKSLDQRTTAIRSSFAEAAQADPEFTEKVGPLLEQLVPSFTLPANVRPTIANVIADELFSEPETAPRVALWLSEHPEDLQRLATLTPRAVAREMARIEARATAATTGTPAAPRVSQAKPPVRPVTGSPQAGDPYEYLEEDSLDAHIAKQNARDARLRRTVTGR